MSDMQASCIEGSSKTQGFDSSVHDINVYSMMVSVTDSAQMHAQEAARSLSHNTPALCPQRALAPKAKCQSTEMTSPQECGAGAMEKSSTCAYRAYPV